jgi:DNA-directed RNA polymerase subunit RPC12/RpoP
MAEIRTCESCRRKFEVLTVGGGMTSPEPEPLKCPYCGFTRQVLSSGRFVTRPLPEDQGRDRDGAPTPN